MDGKNKVGTQVRDILGLLASRQRRGGGGDWDLSSDDTTAIERWDDLTESILAAHDPRGRTITEPLDFLQGTLAERGGLGIEERYLSADRMSLATNGAMFRFTEGLGQRWYWDGPRADGEDRWSALWGDFAFDPEYLVLEDEDAAEPIDVAYARARRPFGTRSRAGAAPQGRPAAPPRALRRAAARRTSAAARGSGESLPLLSLEETAFSPKALPALDTALRRVADVWVNDELGTGVGSAPVGRTASSAAGAPFSPARFDDALSVVTLRTDGGGSATPTAETTSGALPADRTTPFLPRVAAFGLGGGEVPTRTPVYDYAYDAAADVFVVPESEENATGSGVERAVTPVADGADRSLSFSTVVPSSRPSARRRATTVRAPHVAASASRGASVSKPSLPGSGASDAVQAPSSDRYAYARDLSVLPSELFASSVAQRVADETAAPTTTETGAPGAGHVALGESTSRPSALSAALDPVVYLSLPSEDAGTPGVRSGLRRAPTVSSARRLGASVTRRVTAPAVTVSEATRLQQVIAEGIQTERSFANAEQLASTSPQAASAESVAPLGTSGDATRLDSLARSFGATEFGAVPRALRSALPTVGAAVETALRASDDASARPSALSTAIERAWAALPSAAAPRAAIGGGASPEGTALSSDGPVGDGGGLWLRFAGMDPVFVALPAEAPAVHGVASAFTSRRGAAPSGRRAARTLDLAGRSVAMPGTTGTIRKEMLRAAAAAEATSAVDGRAMASPASMSAATTPGAGGDVSPRLARTFAAAAKSDVGAIVAFAPSVARLLGVSVKESAAPRSYGAEEVGALVALERDVRSEVALSGAGAAKSQAAAGELALAAVPEIGAYPYLPRLSREVSEQSRRRALQMTSAVPVQSFLRGRSAAQFARLPLGEQRAVLRQLETMAPPALARAVAGLAAGTDTSLVGAGESFWSGFAPRALGMATPPPSAVTGRDVLGTAGTFVALREEPTSASIASMRMGGAGESFAPEGIGREAGTARWIRETIELLLPAIPAEGTGAMAAFDAPSPVEAKTASSRLAMTGPEGELVQLAAGEQAAEAIAPAGGARPELAARGALRFADRVATQVLGDIAQADDAGEAMLPMGRAAAVRTATGGDDVAGPLYWPGDEMALLTPMAEAPVGTGGVPVSRSTARHGATTGDRDSTGRNWTAAARALAPLAPLSGASDDGGDVVGRGRGGRRVSSASALMEQGSLLALSGDAAAQGTKTSSPATGLRAGLLRTAPETVARPSAGEAAGSSAASLSARFVSWMQDRGVARIAYERLSPALAEAALLALPEGGGGADKAGAPLGFAFGGGSGATGGFAASLLRRLSGSAGSSVAGGGGGGVTTIGRGRDTEAFVSLVGGGSSDKGEERSAAAAASRLFSDAVGETVAVGASAPRRESASTASAVRGMDWGRVSAHTATPAERGGADLGGIASAATMGRDLSRSVLPLVAPVAQQVAQQAAAKADSAPAMDAMRSPADGPKGTAKGKPSGADEGKKIKDVVDRVVARLQERIRMDKERRGGVLF